MAEVFLYRREAGINPQQLQKLRREGFIPVGVEYLSDAKFLVPPVAASVSPSQLDLLLVAALKVFTGGSDYTKARFGEAVARTLLASGIEAATAGETQGGSAEGESPTGNAGDANTHSQVS